MLNLSSSTYIKLVLHYSPNQTIIYSDFAISSTTLAVRIPTPNNFGTYTIDISLIDPTDQYATSTSTQTLTFNQLIISNYFQTSAGLTGISFPLLVKFTTNYLVNPLLTFNQTTMQASMTPNGSLYDYAFNFLSPNTAGNYPLSIIVDNPLYSDISQTLSDTIPVFAFFNNFIATIPDTIGFLQTTLPVSYALNLYRSDIPVSAVITFAASDKMIVSPPGLVNTFTISDTAPFVISKGTITEQDTLAISLKNIDTSIRNWVASVNLFTPSSPTPFVQYSKPVTLESPSIFLPQDAFVQSNELVFVLSAVFNTYTPYWTLVSVIPHTSSLQATTAFVVYPEEWGVLKINDPTFSDLSDHSFTADLVVWSGNSYTIIETQTIRILQILLGINPLAVSYMTNELATISVSLKIINGSGSGTIYASWGQNNQILSPIVSAPVNNTGTQANHTINITMPSMPGTYTLYVSAQDAVYNDQFQVQETTFTVFSANLTSIQTTPHNLYVEQNFSLGFSVNTATLPNDLSFYVSYNNQVTNGNFVNGTNTVTLTAPGTAGTYLLNIYGKRTGHSDTLISSLNTVSNVFQPAPAGSQMNIAIGKSVQLGTPSAVQTEVSYTWTQNPTTGTISNIHSYPTTVTPTQPTTYTITTQSTYYPSLIGSNSVYVFAEAYNLTNVTLTPSSPMLPGSFVTMSWNITSKPTDIQTAIITVGSISDVVISTGSDGFAVFAIPNVANSNFTINLNISNQLGVSTSTSIPIQTTSVKTFTNISDNTDLGLVQSNMAFLAPYSIGTVCTWSAIIKNTLKTPFSSASSNDTGRPIAPRSFSSDLTNLTNYFTTNHVQSVVLLADNTNHLTRNSQTNVTLKAIDDAVWYLRRLGFCVNADMYFFNRLFTANSITPSIVANTLSSYPNLQQLYSNQFLFSSAAVTSSSLPLNNCTPAACGIQFTTNMQTNIGFIGHSFTIPITVTSFGTSGSYTATATINNVNYTTQFTGSSGNLVINSVSGPVSDYTLSITVSDAYFSGCSDMTQTSTFKARYAIHDQLGYNGGGISQMYVDVQNQVGFGKGFGSAPNAVSFVMLDVGLLTVPQPYPININTVQNTKFVVLLLTGFPNLANGSAGSLSSTTIQNAILTYASDLIQTFQTTGQYLLIDETLVNQPLYWSPGDPSPINLSFFRTLPQTQNSIVYISLSDQTYKNVENLTYLSIAMQDYVLQDYGKNPGHYCFVNPVCANLPIAVQLNSIESTGTSALNINFNGAFFQATANNGTTTNVMIPNPFVTNSDFTLTIDTNDATILIPQDSITISIRQTVDFSSIDHTTINLGIAFVAMETYDGSVQNGAFGLRIKMADADISIDASIFANDIRNNGYNNNPLANNFAVFTSDVTNVANILINKGIQDVVFTSWSQQSIIRDGNNSAQVNHIWIYEQLIAQLVANHIRYHGDLSFFAYING